MKIKSIKKLNIRQKRYDIEVEDTHCFFANDILVHNSRFGKDNSGRIFFEGSRTGPQFEPKAFSNYARGKGSSADVIE